MGSHAGIRARPSRALAGILLMLGAVTCFAVMDGTAKWANQTTNPMLTAILRYLGSFMIIGAVCNPWTPVGVPRTRSPWLQLGRGLCLVAATLTAFYSYRHLPLTQATSISFAAPLMVAMIAGPILNEWPGPHRIAAVCTGFVGVLVVTRPWAAGLQPAILMAFAVAVFNALYSVATRLLSVRDSPTTTLFYSGAVGCAVTLPMLAIAGPWPSDPTVWLAIGVLAVLGTVGHWLLTLAHDYAPPSLLAPFFYAQMLGAAVVGWVLFDEVPDGWTILGGGIITLSGLYLLFRERVRGVGPSADRAA